VDQLFARIGAAGAEAFYLLIGKAPSGRCGRNGAVQDALTYGAFGQVKTESTPDSAIAMFTWGVNSIPKRG